MHTVGDEHTKQLESSHATTHCLVTLSTLNVGAHYKHTLWLVWLQLTQLILDVQLTQEGLPVGEADCTSPKFT